MAIPILYDISFFGSGEWHWTDGLTPLITSKIYLTGLLPSICLNLDVYYQSHIEGNWNLIISEKCHSTTTELRTYLTFLIEWKWKCYFLPNILLVWKCGHLRRNSWETHRISLSDLRGSARTQLCCLYPPQNQLTFYHTLWCNLGYFCVT